ncbi:MAG: hypothetical protein SFU87_06210 [Chitinophagaceae bacterium]|nr:hypothetical protein [Chitinophagaceae bacterium]
MIDFLLLPQNWKKFSTGIIAANYSGDKLTLNTTGSFSWKQVPHILEEEFKVVELVYGKKLTLEVTTNVFFAHDASTFEAENNGTRPTFNETLAARGFKGKVFLFLLSGIISRSLQDDYTRLKMVIEKPERHL